MRTILMTGASGVIGCEVLVQAMTTPNPERGQDRWLCLVRGRDEADARSRLAERLANFAPAATIAAILAGIEVIAADLTAADAFSDPRLDAVTHVLHLAADTSWWARDNNRRVNIDATLALAARARRMPGLVRFLHVGTAMICGAGADPLVREDDYPQAGAEHLVHYTKTKAEAEFRLRDAFADLPIVVARPSIVVGHTRLGAAASASIFWMFRAGDKLGLVACDPAGGIDIVPIDWTASALLSLLAAPTLRHRTYHLSAGHGNRTYWRDVVRAFAAYDGEARADYTAFDIDDRDQLTQRFAAVFGLRRALEKTMLRAMQAYYTFCALDVTFDNSRLLEAGIAPPPALPTYLDICLSNPPDMSIPDQFADDLGMFQKQKPAPLPVPMAPYPMAAE